MPYISCRYAPPDPIQTEPEEEGKKRIVCLDDSNPPVEWQLTEDSLVGDWLLYVGTGGTIDPAEELPPPLNPPPEIIAPERDYGAEIDALEARVTALEEKS